MTDPELYCDHCGIAVFVRGIEELQFVHRTGSVFCMTTIAEVNSVSLPKREPSIGYDKTKPFGNLGTKLQEASVDDFGTPVPAVMEKIIDKFAPAPASYPIPRDKNRCRCGDSSYLNNGYCGPNGCYNCPA